MEKATGYRIRGLAGEENKSKARAFEAGAVEVLPFRSFDGERLHLGSVWCAHVTGAPRQWRARADASGPERAGANPARTRCAQQRACDRSMIEFNEVRPHDALGGKTPAEVYRDSEHRSLDPLVPRYPPEW